jgi:hypothetical protein
VTGDVKGDVRHSNLGTRPSIVEGAGNARYLGRRKPRDGTP